MRCLVKISDKVKDKKFAYMLKKIWTPSPPPSLDLAHKKQNSLKIVWLNVALL